jgi:hypothetical protein
VTPTILIIFAGIFFVGLITGAIISFAGIQIGRQIERLNIIVAVHRHKAQAAQEAAQHEEQVL